MLSQKTRISNIFKFQYLKNNQEYRYLFSPNFTFMTVGGWISYFELLSQSTKSLYEEWSPNDSNFYDWAVDMKKNGLTVYWCMDNNKEKYSIAVKADISEEVVFIKDITSDNLVEEF